MLLALVALLAVVDLVHEPLRWRGAAFIGVMALQLGATLLSRRRGPRVAALLAIAIAYSLLAQSLRAS